MGLTVEVAMGRGTRPSSTCGSHMPGAVCTPCAFVGHVSSAVRVAFSTTGILGSATFTPSPFSPVYASPPADHVPDTTSKPKNDLPVNKLLFSTHALFDVLTGSSFVDGNHGSRSPENGANLDGLNGSTVNAYIFAYTLNMSTQNAWSPAPLPRLPGVSTRKSANSEHMSLLTLGICVRMANTGHWVVARLVARPVGKPPCPTARTARCVAASTTWLYRSGLPEYLDSRGSTSDAPQMLWCTMSKLPVSIACIKSSESFVTPGDVSTYPPNRCDQKML